MPVSRARREVQEKSEQPDKLRPYTFHGVHLEEKGTHAVGDCPFCGRDGKFSVEIDTGLWRCLVCGTGTGAGGGNSLVFIRLLQERSADLRTSEFLNLVIKDRKLLSTDTVSSWGVCESLTTKEWLIPGYNIDGKIYQVYKRAWIDGSWRLLPTPGIWPEGKVHHLHFAAQEDSQNIMICEGPWDGMALWEVDQSGSRIIAVPGCNVWRDEWSELCRGKHVNLLYDSDHPRVHGGKIFNAGYDGIQRVTKRLSGIASSVRWLKWGPDGYDPNKPSGWDIRDVLSQYQTLEQRRLALPDLFLKTADALADWFSSTVSLNGKPHQNDIESKECSTWEKCRDAWTVALQMRQDMYDALAIILAVCASTNQGGNQLFLQLVGSAGSGKTTLCDGILVSKYCHHLEHLTGFHSGFKKPGEDGKDCSLISRVNGKTLVTPEADVLMSSPRFLEIMGQQRRIFDGKSGATYKNSDEDTLHVGLRTPWIMAGTPAMMDHDQSHLGDRFLKFIIGDPEESEKRSIMRKTLRSERVAMLESANGSAGSVVDSKTRIALALTGGYVDWLRANVEEKLSLIDISEEAEDRCIDLAELSADLRARPNTDKRKQEVHDSKELPTRLARQNIRMAAHLAVVLNRREIDKDILRIVRKMALDTANGHSLNIVRWLCSPNPKVGGRLYQECGGLMVDTLAMWSGMTPERLHVYLMFLRKIDVLIWHEVKQTNGSWLLSERVYDLYLRVMED